MPDRAALRRFVNAVLNDGLMAILALAMVPLLVADLATGSMSPSPITRFIDLVIVAMFAAEYLLKLAVDESPGRFLRSPWRVMDGVLIVLALLSYVPGVPSVMKRAVAFRLLRVVRVVLFAMKGLGGMGLHAIFVKNRFYNVLAGMILLTLFVSVAVWRIETRHGDPGAVNQLAYSESLHNDHGHIRTLGEALWWGAGCLTTVGTEKNPKSSMGRVLGVFLMIIGISTMGVFTANVVDYFQQRTSGRPAR